MPVHYSPVPESVQLSTKVFVKTKFQIPESILDVIVSSFQIVLKMRVMDAPTSVKLKESILNLCHQDSKLDQELGFSFCLSLYDPSKKLDDKLGIAEQWSFHYSYKEPNNVTKSKVRCFKSHDTTLFLQSVYKVQCTLPILKKDGISLKPQLEYFLKLILIPKSLISDGYEVNKFKPVCHKKKHYLNLEVFYYNEDEADTPTLHEPSTTFSPKQISVRSSLVSNSCNTTRSNPKPSLIPNLRPSSPIPISKPRSQSKVGFVSSPHEKRGRGSFSESLVGSYEESLLSGRMSSLSSKPIEGFTAKISVTSKSQYLASVALNLPFSVCFYQHNDELSYSPYVGKIHLGPDFDDTLRVPYKGQVQLIVKNPNLAAVQFFVVPYDLRDMPNNCKTFLRYKIYFHLPRQTPKLRHAVHLQFVTHSDLNGSAQLYLYRSMRVVFSLRAHEDTEIKTTALDRPPSPLRYTSFEYSAPSLPEILGLTSSSFSLDSLYSKKDSDTSPGI